MRVVSTGRKEIYSLGFAPVTCALFASVRGRGLVNYGPAGSETPRSISVRVQQQLHFTPDGRALYVFDKSNIQKINLETFADPVVIPSVPLPLFRFALSADCTRMVTAHGLYNVGRFIGWRANTDGWEQDWITPEIPLRPYTLALSPTGDQFAYVADAPDPRQFPRFFVIKTRSATTGEEEATGEYPYSGYDHFLFSPDGQQFIGYHNAAILVWPLPQMGKPRTVRNDNLRHFTDAAYHPNSRYLFTTSNDATVVVWDTQSWEAVKRYTWKIGPLKAVAVSPDGTVAAAGGKKGQIVVWDLDL